MLKPLVKIQLSRAIVELKHALEENAVARGPLLSKNTDKNDVSIVAAWLLRDTMNLYHS